MRARVSSSGCGGTIEAREVQRLPAALGCDGRASRLSLQSALPSLTGRGGEGGKKSFQKMLCAVSATSERHLGGGGEDMWWW